LKTISSLPRLGFLYLSSILVASLFATSTFACTTDQWATATGAVNANDPLSAVPRVKGLCGLQVTETGTVSDDSPSVDTNFIGHFYFFPEFTGSGTVDLFVAYSDDIASSEVFTVRYDGTNVILDASASGGAAPMVSVPADSTHWNLVEFRWTSGAEGSLWVNSDATKVPPDAVFDSGTNSIESVKLGVLNAIGLAGTANFDEYVSHRTTQIGMLLAGDANSDGKIDSGDIDLVVAEFLRGELADGVIDCNLDGNIDSGDIDCVVQIFLGL
jgi:hypothetical protein